MRKVRKEQVYIHTNILQMPLSMRQFSKEFVKKLIIPSPTKLQGDIVLDNLLAIEMVPNEKAPSNQDLKL